MIGPSGSKTTFNASVHGARGLFAVMVFVFHVANSGLAGWIAPQNPLALYVLGGLKFGVELFFGISGFVIIGALRRAPSIAAFLWDRATRIYPLLWTTLVAITVVSAAAHLWRPPVSDWLLNFLAPPPFFPLPQVNPAAWSLGYEVTFYLLCAALYVRRHDGRWWLPVTVAVTIAAVVLFPRAVLMPAGVAIAAGYFPRSVQRTLGRAPLLALMLFLVGWRLVDLACGGEMMRFTPFVLPFSRWALLLPLAVGAALCGAASLGGIVAEQGTFAASLRTRPVQWLGAISYSFYLWHPVAIAGTKALMIRSGVAAASGSGAQAMLMVFSLPAALIVAHVSQRLIEVRLTRYLRRHGPRDDRGAAPTTVVAVGPVTP